MPRASYHLESPQITFTLDPTDNTWELTDKRAGIRWGNASGKPWAHLLKTVRGKTRRVPLHLADVEGKDGALRCRMARPNGRRAPVSLVFRVREDALEVYAIPDEGTAMPALELFSAGLEANAKEDGAALVPCRMGLLLPADSPQAFERSFGTYEYEGCHMAMAGLIRSGAALLAAWGDPYLTLNARREVMSDDRRVGLSFALRGSARSLGVRCLGQGGVPELASAYRERAEVLGYRESLSRRPATVKLDGACNFKLWTALARRIDANMVEQSVIVRWTFDEVAQIAEHLKHDLKLDGVLLHLGGWTRYGYDCKHPDNMPANPECGGNEALANCARRVQALGYSFCLHDNYQDMYRDAPSWDERYLQKKPDGSPFVGGVWLGGQAYYTCAREALKLAQRPENLPLIHDTFHPDLYFVDTTYAVGPQECFDPRHPLTKQEDIRWKEELSDYARQVFGGFGSECGREWAVPHADFFEGIVSVNANNYHMLKPEELGGAVVPFFDMIFRDRIAAYGKYGYKPAEAAELVLHHIACGRPLHYHSLGDHLYWQQERKEELPLPEKGLDRAVFTRAHGGWAEGMCLWDRYMKNTHEVLGPLHRLTADALIERYDFLDASRAVRRTTFTNGVTAVVNGSSEDYCADSTLGGTVVLPPYGFLVEAPTFAAFHARSWAGREYDAPALFTLTSADGAPLGVSEEVRIFHGFGDAVLNWRGRDVVVKREEVI